MMEVAEEPALWDRWRVGGDAAARERLAGHYTRYARIVAASYYAKRFNDEIEFSDYFQLACVGLLEALDRFDPAHGVQFKTFAARRMHGAILDGIERATEKQQQIAARKRIVNMRVEAAKSMAEDPGAKPGSRTPEQALSFVADVGLGLALSWLLEGTGMVDTGERPHSMPFYRSVELNQLRKQVHELVDQLPAQERTVIRGHYLQEMPFERMAPQLGVSRSRIAQIHRQALLRLRSGLQSQGGIDTAL